MTLNGGPHAERALAKTLISLCSRAEEITRAHDRLDLPAPDEGADWPSTIAAIDAMGEGAHQLARLVRDELIPILKTLKTHAVSVQDEIARLDAQFAGAAREGGAPGAVISGTRQRRSHRVTPPASKAPRA